MCYIVNELLSLTSSHNDRNNDVTEEFEMKSPLEPKYINMYNVYQENNSIAFRNLFM